MTYVSEPYRVGRWIANQNAFNLTFDLASATFGKPAPYRCSRCGPTWYAPKYYRLHKQTWLQPEEGEVRCPECGSEECGDNEEGCPITVIRRYSIHMSPSYRETR